MKLLTIAFSTACVLGKLSVGMATPQSNAITVFTKLDFSEKMAYYTGEIPSLISLSSLNDGKPGDSTTILYRVYTTPSPAEKQPNPIIFTNPEPDHTLISPTPYGWGLMLETYKHNGQGWQSPNTRFFGQARIIDGKWKIVSKQVKTEGYDNQISVEVKGYIPVGRVNPTANIASAWSSIVDSPRPIDDRSAKEPLNEKLMWAEQAIKDAFEKGFFISILR
ncbi:MAG: hypothetical protein M1829_004567 [Trizodia sp. TS-e1964]|nr:MAG: hypothetical protein M1829_004567 [Trizodia sp. TS-e1964]